MRSLATYQKKRDFKKTAEPRGQPIKKSGFSYVIQKHAARRLHYDFRLELDGVLLSWAVPKGPSLDPSVERLAQQTEDHPIEYGGFEGTIPKGQYGGGTVMLWDRGTWVPEGDAREQYAKGRLTFELRGERLKGRWHLVRTGRDKGQGWLLFKSQDEHASKNGEALVEEATTSVLSERSMEEIESGDSAQWISSRATQSSPRISTRARAKRAKSAESSGSARQRAPSIPEPQLATLVDTVPEGDDYIHEVKLDGYRILARVHGKDVQLVTRNSNDWTERLPSVAAALRELPVKSVVLDGELVAVGADGVTNFQKLQNALSTPEGTTLLYCLFDILHLDGHDLTALPLEQRKELLAALLGQKSTKSSRAPKGPRPLSARGGLLRYSEHIVGRGSEFFRAASELGLEGVISKRRTAPYRSGRSRDWLKTKCISEQEFVIGGYTEPTGSRSHLGALLVGVWEGDELVYSGKVGTGFTRKSLAELAKKLRPLARKTSPFRETPSEVRRGVHWVEPVTVAQVAFTELTEAHRLRHPTFRGLREDKPTKSVAVERAERVDPPPRAAPGKRASGQSAVATLPLSNPNKVLYPESGITKQDLARYYAEVADYMLPHVVDRPLTLVRCPEGWKKQCFFQKHVDKGRPKELRPVTITEKEGTDEYLTLYDAAGIHALVQMGVLEIHTWGSRAKQVEQPDLLVFDLDPDAELAWSRVVEAAMLLKRLFEQFELVSFVKTTGGKGLHVCVPVKPRFEWDEVKQFCQDVAESISRLAPDQYLATVSKAKRKGKIFIDYLRNGRGATFIAPYSTRAREGATVATPVAWDEIASLEPRTLNLKTVPERLARLSRDPWEGLVGVRQGLSAAMLRSVAGAARKA